MVAIIVWVVIGLLALLVLITIYYFNRFVVLGNRIDNSLSQIDVQLKKRADLVPNLIASVKGYMKHERGVISEVTNARKALLAAGNMQEKVKAGNELQHALKSIFALAENYPQLRANENFLQLQQELTTIEDRIAYSRQFYNDSILVYNNSVQAFPGMVFAGMYGRKAREFLQIPQEEKAVPKVDL